MKHFSFTVVLLTLIGRAVAADNVAVKPSPLEGTWKWNFTMPDGAEAAPQIKFKTDKKGALTGTSTFRKGSETPVTNLLVKGDKVSFDVVRNYLGDKVVTHYAGTFRGDLLQGRITSKANGEEQVYDWEAKRISGLDGVWKWSVSFGGRPIEFALTLKQEGEKLTGKIKGYGETEIRRGKFKEGNFSFETERTNREGIVRITRYHGKFANEKLAGKVEMNFGGEWQTNKWEPTRAD